MITTSSTTMDPTGVETDKSPLFLPLAQSALFLRLVVAGTVGVNRCIRDLSAPIGHSSGALVASSTQIIVAAVEAKLDALLQAAREEDIEDGMQNSVSQHLPALVAGHADRVIPALVSMIEAGRTPPIVAAEALKELGHLRNGASHAKRRWVLEWALGSRSPVTRDGAGLGLARLGDPHSLRYLARAVENEVDPQLRADLQLVVDELVEATQIGTPSEANQ